MIYHLLNRLKDFSELRIIALSLNRGILTNKLQEAGIETYVIQESNHFIPNICLRAITLLKGKRIDIIHSHRYKENLLALLLGKALRVRNLISTLHGLPEPALGNANGAIVTGLKARLNYFIMRNTFSSIAAVSEGMRNVLVRDYDFPKGKVVVVYNGIEVPRGIQLHNRESIQFPNRHFHIGTIGRMVSVKGYDLFLEVAGEMIRQTTKVRFSILGEGPLKEKLVRKARELKVEGHVEFVSERPDPFTFYQDLDLYLNTSLNEGIPMSILEAMACGLPVVATNIGGIPEIISHGEDGLLVEGREPKKYVQSCLRIMEDPKLRITLGQNAIKKVQSCFDSSKMAESYVRLYQKACAIS